MSARRSRGIAFLSATVLVSAPFLSYEALAAPAGTFATLTPAELTKVVSDPTLAPSGVTIDSTYVQDLGVREGLLCYTADWKPVTIAPAHMVWRALQGPQVGGAIRILQYPTQKAAAASMKAMVAAQCPNGANPKTPLTQVKTTLPVKNGAPGVAVTSTMIDDGAFETHDAAYRQIGKAIVEVSILSPGKANAAISSAIHPQLPVLADRAVQAYRAAASR